MNIPSFSLNNSITMPIIGLGVWQMKNGPETEQAVLWALESGYRLIDTAMAYGNEHSVGTAVRKSPIKREDIFITTKLWRSDQGHNNALRAIDESLSRLGMDYVDLYLIHWPYIGLNAKKIRAETWRAMEQIYQSGKSKAIGVSNYDIDLLEEMKDYANVPPAVNQVEFNPFEYSKALLEYCKANNIAVEAYSPLMHGDNINDPRITVVARKYHKTNAQVLLRWCIQHDTIPIPKSSHQERIKENINIFDFELAEADVNMLDEISSQT